MESKKFLLCEQELKRLAEKLFEEAFNANMYWSIIKQYHYLFDQYNRELNCSPAFHSVVYRSLVESLMVTLSRLYDENSSAISTQYFYSEIRKQKDLLCEGKGNVKHLLNRNEEQFYVDEVKFQKGVCEKYSFEYTGTTVELTVEKLLELYGKRLKSLKDTVNNLKLQRNKIYAHNDKEIDFNIENILNRYPIAEEDVDNLLSFILDFSSFCIELFTGISKTYDLVGINDLEITLDLIREAKIYQETELERLGLDHYRHLESEEE